MGADRIEIEGPADGDTAALKRMGCIAEIVSWRTRLFAPDTATLAQIVERWPVATPARAASRGPGPASGSSSLVARAAPSAPASVRRASTVSADSAERSMLCPPSVTCEPPGGPDRRPATASTAWPATVRPNRDSHIFCNGSELTISATGRS